MFVDTYISTSNILADTDEIHNSQIYGRATAKPGLQFPGLHSASPQKTRQVQSTRYFYWRLIKKRCTRIRILNISPISDHTY